MDTALLFWERIISDSGLPRGIVSDRDPKFTSLFWQGLSKLMGTSLQLSTSHHPQTDGLAERMIQTLEDMVRRYCAFGLTFKDKDGFEHDWVTLTPALEIAYNSSVHATTGKTPFVVERGFNPRTAKDLINQKAVDIHPTALSFHEMLTKAREHATHCIAQSLEYEKNRWDKSHKLPEFKVGDEVLVSTVNFDNLQGPRKLRDSFVGPFVIIKMHGPNAAEVVLTGEFARKHPTFPVSLIKHFHARAKDGPKHPTVTPFADNVPKVAHKILRHKRIMDKGQSLLLYLVRYKNKSADSDEWLAEKDIINSNALLRQYRIDKKRS